jgi:hypothetical protein
MHATKVLQKILSPVIARLDEEEPSGAVRDRPRFFDNIELSKLACPK